MTEDETEESYGKRLGAVITELRLARDMDTQQKLADRVGRHVSTIQRWETNATMPNAWNIRELAQALQVDVATLLYPPDQLTPEILDVAGRGDGSGGVLGHGFPSERASVDTLPDAWSGAGGGPRTAPATDIASWS